MAWQYIAYPQEGGTIAVGQGDTTIDFYDGRVTSSAGVVTNLSKSLRQIGQNEANGVTVETSGTVLIKLDDGDWWTVDQAITIDNIPFRMLTIHAFSTVDIRAGCFNAGTTSVKTKGTASGGVEEWQVASVANTACTLTTEHSGSFRLVSVLIHWNAASTCTVNVYATDKTDSNYTTLIFTDAVVAATNKAYLWSYGEMDLSSNHEIYVTVSAGGIGVITYMTITTGMTGGSL